LSLVSRRGAARYCWGAPALATLPAGFRAEAYEKDPRRGGLDGGPHPEFIEGLASRDALKLA